MIIPTVLETQGYYPFGLVNPWYSHDSDYRYGYQGEYSEELFEEDLDGDNTAGWNAFMLRMYDARIGRWLSVDPYRQYASSYKGMGNNPLNGVDPDGGLFGKWRARRFAEEVGGTAYKDSETGTWWVEYSTGSIEGGDYTAHAKEFGIRTPSWGQVAEFSAFAANAINSNETLGLINRWDCNGDPECRYGQITGDAISTLMSIGEMFSGGSLAVSGGAVSVTGAGAVVGVPAVAAGAGLVTHGGLVLRESFDNLLTGIKNDNGRVYARSRGDSDVKKMSDQLIKELGLDAHAIKKDFLGDNAKISRYDLYKHTETGEILIYRKGGQGEPIYTGYYID